MNNPLVSIPVITYNSSEYIIEGLESIKAQTYKNIELIISDDCSSDNTIKKCQKWISENKRYFKRALIVTTKINTGVAGNLNRAIKECQGEWIKVLSGDDKFYPFTIERYIANLNKITNARIFFARMHLEGDTNVVKKILPRYSLLFEEIKNPHKQYKRYLHHHYVPGPGLIFKKSLWEDIHGYDERYPFSEELSFTLYSLKRGERIYYIDEELYRYTIRKDSISNSGSINYLNFRDQWNFLKDVRGPEMIKNGLFLKAIDEYITFYITNERLFKNTSKLKGKLISFLYLLSPLWYTAKIKLLFIKLTTQNKQ